MRDKKPKLFDNCVIQAPDGVVLGLISRKRLEWYLKRQLADLLMDEPPTIRLRFEPSGRKGVNHPLIAEPKNNFCVVCGSDEKLNRHHIIPYCIIKELPAELKDHNSQDILAVCLKCHEKYEERSLEKKRELAKRLGISIHGLGAENFYRIRRLCGLSRALCFKNDIPVPSRKKIMDRMAELYGSRPDEKTILYFATTRVKEIIDYVPFGRVVAESITDYGQFFRDWRQHFLDVMQPRFMSSNWQIDRSFK